MSGAESMFPWLLDPPEDFRAQLKLLSLEPNVDVTRLRRLATTAMDGSQVARLGKAVDGMRNHLVGSEFAPVKLGLVGSYTLDYVAESLIGTGVRHGLLIEPVKTDYGQVMQTVLDQNSPLVAARVDAVLLSLDAASLGLATPILDDDETAACIDAAIDQIRLLRDGIRHTLMAIPVLQTIPLSVVPLFGGFDVRMRGSPRNMLETFNRRLVEEIISSGDLLVDTAFVAAAYGLDRWHDPRGWYSAKMPFALEVAPLYADHLCRVLGAAKGKSRKCLVLDLDNTLWGGVIGDDGIEGIKLGQGNAAGEAFLAIQTFAFNLRRRGVILAVCSKNDDAVARMPFRYHQDMVLKEEHIAAFVANWSDKAANLREIAAILNIGTDALVFLDDNPAEREMVRRELPEVAVPEVGDDPALYPGLLASAGYFEAVAFADEDRKRADMYRGNAERRAAASSVTNLGDYLTSLQMVMTASHFDVQGRARIAQLTNKSNQFNLTTHRYSEADIALFEENPGVFALQVRLVDKFGDNGMISVIIFNKGDQTWECDTWLMSCRVLGRRVEEAVLDIVSKAALGHGATALRGRYKPTPKNGLVAEHFAKLGFAKIAEAADGTTDWELSLRAYIPPALPMRVQGPSGSYF